MEIHEEFENQKINEFRKLKLEYSQLPVKLYYSSC